MTRIIQLYNFTLFNAKVAKTKKKKDLGIFESEAGSTPLAIPGLGTSCLIEMTRYDPFSKVAGSFLCGYGVENRPISYWFL